MIYYSRASFSFKFAMNPPGRQVIIRQNSKFPGRGRRTLSHAVLEITTHRRWWTRLSRNTTKVLQKLLKFQMYMDQLLQSLLECDTENWYEFGDKMISYVEPADNLLDKCIFSESATFHVSSEVNRHVSISETGSQRAVVEHQCHCPKATLFCVMWFSKFMNYVSLWRPGPAWDIQAPQAD